MNWWALTGCGVNISASGVDHFLNAVHWPIFCASAAKARSASIALRGAAAAWAAASIKKRSSQAWLLKSLAAVGRDQRVAQ